MPHTHPVFAEQTFLTSHFNIVYHLSRPNKLDSTDSDSPSYTIPDGIECNDWPSEPDFIHKLTAGLSTLS